MDYKGKYLDLEIKHLEIIKTILANNLPKTSKVLVFGSRAGRNAKKFSDLDLAVDLNRKITLSESANLKNDFSNSDLPYFVDILDMNSIDNEFKQAILSNPNNIVL